LRLRPFRAYTDDFIEAHLIRYDMVEKKAWRCEEIVWTEIVTGEIYPRSPITFDNSEAQELMDMLWQCGVRPTEGAGTAGSMRATENHLKDLQRIAFGLLKQRGMKE